MKKLVMLVIAIFVMSFASNNLFAQNDETSQAGDQLVSTLVSEEGDDAENVDSHESDTNQKVDEGSKTEVTPANTSSKSLNAEDLQAIASFLSEATNGKKQNILNADNKVFVPLYNNGKISGHHLCQRIELSFLMGKDKSAEDIALADLGLNNKGAVSPSATSKSDNFLDNVLSKGNSLNFGANFGYSLVFVPGFKDGDKLLLNRFGFGYSVGAIFQFDREREYDITCDLMGKVGVETGFNKAVGVGVDFLFGGGKTSQTVVDFSLVDEKEPNPDDVELMNESLWCGKIGWQLWLRLNFLTKSLKNFDTAIFTRYVYSFKPYSENEYIKRIEMYSEIPYWQEESWQFGITATYFF